MNAWMFCVTYRAKPGMRERFLQRVMESGILEKIQQEEGCLGYEYYSPFQDPDRILLVEKWASKEAQETHLKQPHMGELKEIKDSCIADTTLESYEITV